MTKKSCYTRSASVCDHRQNGLSEFPEQQGSSSSSSSSSSSAGAKKKPWKRYYLTFLSKFQSKTKRKKPADSNKASTGSRQLNSGRGLLRSLPMLEERRNLAQAIRRAAAGCFAAKLAAGAGDEDGLPYVQLGKVSHGEKREVFGPVYLVT